jgi:hypothetical protein
MDKVFTERNTIEKLNQEENGLANPGEIKGANPKWGYNIKKVFFYGNTPKWVFSSENLITPYFSLSYFQLSFNEN